MRTRTPFLCAIALLGASLLSLSLSPTSAGQTPSTPSAAGVPVAASFHSNGGIAPENCWCVVYEYDYFYYDDFKDEWVFRTGTLLRCTGDYLNTSTTEIGTIVRHGGTITDVRRSNVRRC